MSRKDTDSVVSELEADLRHTLENRHGTVMSGKALWTSLGYRSVETFRRAAVKGDLPVPVFEIPGRRGKFALAKDVARWLAERRASAEDIK
jgi:hypothetical protein